MPLETGTKISDLNPAWPLGTDPKSQGDDHLRLIKAIMQLDALSLADGGTVAGLVDFTQNPTVPDGATGKEAVNADDVPGLAGTGPVEIVESGLPGASWQVWGDTLIQFFTFATVTAIDIAPFPIAFKAGTVPVCTITSAANVASYISVEAIYDSGTDHTGVKFFGHDTRSGGDRTPTVTIIAVGEAPDALKKPKTVQTIGGSELQEFHDPTGAASWRVVGSTLECWGIITLNSTGVPVTFPKTFARNPTMAYMNALDAADTGQANIASHDNLSATGFTIYGGRSNTILWTYPVDIHWRAIGEWDGVS